MQLRHLSRKVALRVFVAGIAVLAIGGIAGGLAAAGSTGGTRTVRPAVSSHASKSTYTVGLDYNASGALAPYSVGVASFYQAWIDYTNAHGGVEGHKIKVITLDDKGDPGQTLLNFEALWGQDHVLAIIGGGTYTPWSYVKQNNVVVLATSGGSGSRGFASYYPTWFTTGSLSPTWNSQAAYWSVKIEHKKIKTVELEYNPVVVFGPWLAFEDNYWKKLGATTVYNYADQGSSANCTPLILSMKANGVQYLDLQGPEFPQCIAAEETLNWRPPLGQGAPETSQIGEAELLGKSLTGVIAGSPNSLYTGAPIHSTPDAQDRMYVANITKYAPQFANYSFLNGTGQLQYYSLGMLTTSAIGEALHKFGVVTPQLLAKTLYAMRHYTNGDLQPPIDSFAANCKTGGDGTIWGYWHYNPHPTPALPMMYMVPTSGPKWVTTRAFLGYGPCYLTQLSNQIYPNG
jgi:hypothetical protein